MSFKHTVVMPKMSMTMETGELIGFHVAEGQEVKAGDVLFEVMTDKIDMEVEAPADGKIEKLLASPGQVLEVGKPVLSMETTTQVLSFDFAESGEVSNTSEAAIPEVEAKVEEQIVNAVTPEAVTESANKKSVPAARKLANEKGINLQSIRPTGPFETITYEDVANADIDPNIAKRKEANKALIAKGIEMTLAIPQSSFTRTVKASEVDSVKILRAWGKVLRSFSKSNNSNIGVALIIESKYGSALPVFKDPDQLEPGALADLVRTTTEQARGGKVPLAMLNGATTTIFDLTGYQMAGTKPTLFPNQSTGLTIGRDTQGQLALYLTIDLRALDFYDGAALLDALARELA
jgi:pyruvate dehydrogenase E2 component (dihydrolipoamide acetyltransferase)